MKPKTQSQELALRPQSPSESRELEQAASPEQLPHSPRIVVYGSRGAGSDDLYQTVTDQLTAQGITGVDVDVSRQVHNIQGAFYGRYAKKAALPLPAGELALPEVPADKKHGLLRRIGGKLLSRSEVVVAPVVESPQPAQDTIPAGVLVLPEMRQRLPYLGTNTSVDTPYEAIEELCHQFGVPLVYVEKGLDTTEALEQGVRELFSSPEELPPVTQ